MFSNCRNCGIRIEQGPGEEWYHELHSGFWHLCPKDPEKALEMGSAYVCIDNQADTHPEPTHCMHCNRIIQITDTPLWINDEVHATNWVSGHLQVDKMTLFPDHATCGFDFRNGLYWYHWPAQNLTDEEAITGLQRILLDL